MRASGSILDHTEPLTAADLQILRLASEPGGLRLSLANGRQEQRLERLYQLNQRRLLSFGGVRRVERGGSELVYAVSDVGRKMFALH